MTAAKSVDLTVYQGGKKIMTLASNPLYEGLLYAAHLLTSEQRLELIKDLQDVHAKLEARFR